MESSSTQVDEFLVRAIVDAAIDVFIGAVVASPLPHCITVLLLCRCRSAPPLPAASSFAPSLRFSWPGPALFPCILVHLRVPSEAIPDRTSQGKRPLLLLRTLGSPWSPTMDRRSPARPVPCRLRRGLLPSAIEHARLPSADNLHTPHSHHTVHPH